MRPSPGTMLSGLPHTAPTYTQWDSAVGIVPCVTKGYQLDLGVSGLAMATILIVAVIIGSREFSNVTGNTHTQIPPLTVLCWVVILKLCILILHHSHCDRFVSWSPSAENGYRNSCLSHHRRTCTQLHWEWGGLSSNSSSALALQTFPHGVTISVNHADLSHPTTYYCNVTQYWSLPQLHRIGRKSKNSRKANWRPRGIQRNKNQTRLWENIRCAFTRGWCGVPRLFTLIAMERKAVWCSCEKAITVNRQ